MLPSFCSDKSIRLCYLESVKLMKEIYENTLVEPKELSIDDYNTHVNLLMKETGYTKNILSFVKATPVKSLTENYVLEPSRNFDIITAFYIPEDSDDIKLYIYKDSKISEYDMKDVSNERITINKLVYKKVTLVKPAIPVCTMKYAQIYLTLPDSKVYIETIRLTPYFFEIVTCTVWTCLAPSTDTCIMISNGTPGIYSMTKMMENGKIQ